MDNYVNGGEDFWVTDEVTDEAIVWELQTPDNSNFSDDGDNNFPSLVSCDAAKHATKTLKAFALIKALLPNCAFTKWRAPRWCSQLDYAV